MKNPSRKPFAVCFAALALAACADVEDPIAGDPPPPPDNPAPVGGAPALKGQLIYHNYSDYGARDSKMYLYDFEANTLQRISDGWNIRHAMNAHFSPDGTQIVFMGLRHNADIWDVYLHDIGSAQQPVNLTPTDTRDEDPKFSPDGKRIVFKRRLADDTWRIAEMDLASRQITLLPFDDDEYSMPYYNADGTKIVASKGASHAQSSIVLIDLAEQTVKPLYDAPGVQDYYPINADATSFYYSSGYSTQWNGDQVWRGYWSGAPAERLPFNDTEGDYSDATPAGSDWVILCSTRPGGAGSYDLYIANTQSGEIFPMSDYHNGINTPLAELGPTVFIRE